MGVDKTWGRPWPRPSSGVGHGLPYSPLLAYGQFFKTWLSIAVNLCKGAVTLGNFSCNLSRNFVATQVARCDTGCLNRVTLGNVSCNLSRSRRSQTAPRTGTINNINWGKKKRTMNCGSRKRKDFALLVKADLYTANKVFHSDGSSFNA